MVKKFPVKFLEDRKCIFCGSWRPYRLADGRVKCRKCRQFYSLKKLKRDLDILHYIALELSANRTASELYLSYKTVLKRYMFFREKIAKYSDNNFRKLSGELEIDDARYHFVISAYKIGERF